MLLYLTKDELDALYYMIEAYIFEFDYPDSIYVTKLDRQLRNKLKKEYEYYETDK